MLKNLTIKMKLFLSFGIIALLILLSSIYNVFGINQGSDGFKEYRQMAKQGLIINQLQSSMLFGRVNVIYYLKDKSDKNIQGFNQQYNITKEFLLKAKEEITDPKRKESIIEMQSVLEKYKADFDQIVLFMKKRDQLVNQIINTNGKEIEQILTSIMKSTKQDNDLTASIATGQSLRSVLLLRLYVEKFLKTNSQEDLDRVTYEINELNDDINALKTEIDNPTRKELLNKTTTLISQYNKAVIDVQNTILQRNKVVKDIVLMGKKISELSEEVKLSLKTEQDRIGPEVQNLNENLKTVVLVISIIVVLLVVLFALTIPRAISNQITVFQDGLLKFFSFLNREIHDTDLINIDSNDEIGNMTKVVNQNIEKTKKVIQEDREIIDDVTNVVTEVRNGRFNKRIEKSTSNESLMELKTIFNQMLEVTSTNVCEDINKINRVLANFEKLDFTDRVENDVGNVAKALNKLADIITEMLIENKTNGLTLDKSSNVLLENVDQLNVSSNEAAASLEETASALEEITSNIRNNTNNIAKMADYSNGLTNSAQNGEKLANQTNVSMDEINDQVNAINEAITVIDQIAFQTNILSLNAAVEAATAGEAGKGFAVVAQEVRNLASRSAEAAKEIKDIVEVATSKANQGKEIANHMIDGYKDLNENISNTTVLIKDIEMSSKEQLSGIEQINDAVGLLDRQTQRNAAIASQTHDIAVLTDNIAKLVVQSADEKEFKGKDEVQAQSLDIDTNSSRQTFQEEIKNTPLSKPELKKTVKYEESDQDGWDTF